MDIYNLERLVFRIYLRARSSRAVYVRSQRVFTRKFGHVPKIVDANVPLCHFSFVRDAQIIEDETYIRESPMLYSSSTFFCAFSRRKDLLRLFLGHISCYGIVGFSFTPRSDIISLPPYAFSLGDLWGWLLSLDAFYNLPTELDKRCKPLEAVA